MDKTMEELNKALEMVAEAMPQPITKSPEDQAREAAEALVKAAKDDHEEPDADNEGGESDGDEDNEDEDEDEEEAPPPPPKKKGMKKSREVVTESDNGSIVDELPNGAEVLDVMPVLKSIDEGLKALRTATRENKKTMRQLSKALSASLYCSAELMKSAKQAAHNQMPRGLIPSLMKGTQGFVYGQPMMGQPAAADANQGKIKQVQPTPEQLSKYGDLAATGQVTVEEGRMLKAGYILEGSPLAKSLGL